MQFDIYVGATQDDQPLRRSLTSPPKKADVLFVPSLYIKGAHGIHENNLCHECLEMRILELFSGRRRVCPKFFVFTNVCRCLMSSTTSMVQNEASDCAHQCNIQDRLRLAQRVMWHFMLAQRCNVLRHLLRGKTLASSQMAWMFYVVGEGWLCIVRMARAHLLFSLTLKSVQYAAYVPCCDWWHSVLPYFVCKDGSHSATSSKIFNVMTDAVDVERRCRLA